VSLPTTFNRAAQPFTSDVATGGATSYSTPSPTPPSPSGGGGGWGGASIAGAQNNPQYASTQPAYSSTSPALSTPAGFIPPPGGYGAPTTTLQQTAYPYPPSGLSGYTPQYSGTQQQAGFSPLNTQPNYNMMMGGTTGYKSTMK
jgi:hypothetical protein